MNIRWFRWLALRIEQPLRADLLTMLALAVLGVAFYFYRFGWVHFWPTSIEWMLAGGDSSTYYIGWTYFRHEPWGWPLGQIQGYLAPIGTSIPLVDALPLMAIPLKTIARWLPENFQYFGIWTCLSYALQAVFGYVLVGHVSSRRSTRVLGALILLIFPPLLKRHTHVALASHWILLAALAAYFRLATKTFRIRLVTWIALAWLASVVHPYLTVMVLGLATAAWVRAAGAHHRRDRWCNLVVPLGLLGVVALSFAAVGHLVYAGDPHPGAGGYGIYSLNLNAVFNPMHSSHFLKTLPWINSAQAEGMNYAGIGMLVLGFVASACVLARPRNYGVVLRHWPLVTVLMVFTVFSWSNQVSLGDRVLFDYPLLKAANPLVASLRASGRFFWPVLYTGMLGVIWVLAREMPRRISTVLISVVSCCRSRI